MTAAAKMRYNAKGYLHISEMMWLNGQESLSKKILTLSWMTGEFAAFKDETLRQCASQSINCRTMSRDLLITMSPDLRHGLRSALKEDNAKELSDKDW